MIIIRKDNFKREIIIFISADNCRKSSNFSKVVLNFKALNSLRALKNFKNLIILISLVPLPTAEFKSVYFSIIKSKGKVEEKSIINQVLK